MRKVFLALLGVILLFSLVPAIVIPIVNANRLVNYFNTESQHNGNYDELQKKIANQETFIAYYGFASCPFCKAVTEKLAYDETLKKTITQIEEDLNLEKDLIQFFYRWNRFTDEERTSFEGNLKTLRGFTPPSDGEGIGVPYGLFYKEGILRKQFTPNGTDVEGIITALNEIYA